MDEFLVTNRHGHGRPAIVGLGSEFVVVWTEPGDQNLRGARFDRAGNTQNEFQVNTTPGIFGLVTAERIRFISVLGGINGTEGQKITADLFNRDGTSLGVTVSQNRRT